MDLKEALCTEARRYCIQRHAYWAEVYEGLQRTGRARSSFGYTEQAYATFPRYLVWQAILDQVERFTTADVPTIDMLRQELITAGRRAETMLTSNPQLPPVALAAMAEEREAFAQFLSSIEEINLHAVEPLEFRRVLGALELQQVWENLRTQWGVRKHDYWWPLREGAAPPDVLMFHTDWFDDTKVAVVRGILVDLGITRVLEVREFGEWGCEQSVITFEPIYTGEEGYWTSNNVDWLIYASHESSISLAGDLLVRNFRLQFSESDQFTYGGPFSTPDRRGTCDW